MSRPTTWTRAAIAAVAALVSIGLAVFATLGSGAASASVVSGKATMAAMALSPGHGDNEFGMTHAYFRRHGVRFTYTHGYFCDTRVSSSATSKCEVGQKWTRAPGPHEPLFITVPLGFSPRKMVDCPANLTCVDHPMTVDLTRLEPALKPLYPKLTDAQLTAALKNFVTPEHDHFVTTKAGGHRIWWDVYVVGVTSPKVFHKIRAHQSYAYIRHLIRSKNPNVVGPIPSNLFLFFAVHR